MRFLTWLLDKLYRREAASNYKIAELAESLKLTRKKLERIVRDNPLPKRKAK